MAAPVRVLVVGCGHMGTSHARAYEAIDGFELAGVVSRGAASRQKLLETLGVDRPQFSDFATALAATRPDAVSINTYPDTHAAYTLQALAAGCHVFLEKPIAETVEQAREVAAAARAARKKLVIGYILRVHPTWARFVEIASGLGRPLVMRMNLNQQSSGANWQTHRNLLSSLSPIVDCGVHYIEVMCRMTQARPIRVSGLRARLTDDLPAGRVNYGHLQVAFDDGSVGWYEAGWGPMMSETAFFVKDVVGPKGCVSIMARKAASAGKSADVGSHSATESLLRHHSDLAADGTFSRADEWIDVSDEPSHDELCRREQEVFLRAIREDLDLTAHLQSAIDSLRVVIAADQSAIEGRTIDL